MDSDDDLFDFSQENLSNNNKNLNNVLVDIFENTQKQTEIEIKKLNITNKCKNYSQLNFHHNYKKFIYPSNEDIINEMNDTRNPNCNRWDANSKKGEFESATTVNPDLPDSFIVLSDFDKSFFEDEEVLNNNSFNETFQPETKNVKDISRNATGKHYDKIMKGKLTEALQENFQARSVLPILSQTHLDIFNKAKEEHLKVVSGKNIMVDFESSNLEAIQSSSVVKNKEKSTSKQDMYISEQAEVKIKAIFEDIDTSKKERLQKNENHINENILEPQFIGFKYASGKGLFISDQAKNKSRAIFEDIYTGIKELLPNNEDTTEENDFKKQFFEIKSTSGKVVYISDQYEINTEIEVLSKQNIENHKEAPIDNPFIGFKLASGKDINVSDQAKNRVRTIFEDIGTKEELSQRNKNDSKGNTIDMCMADLQPVSGNCTSIPDQANNESKTTLEDIDSVKENSSQNNENSLKENTIDKQFIGFRLASGKSISISDQAKNKVKTIFENIETKEELLHKQNEIQLGEASIENIFFGFKSASGKGVTISDQAKHKAQIIFVDIESDKEDILQNNKNDSKETTIDKQFIGFKSASGKSISISDQAKNKVKTIFENIETDKEFLPKQSKETLDESYVENIFLGFKSASGKDIAISDQAKDKVKTIFENMTTEENDILQDNDKQYVTGSDQTKNNDKSIFEEVKAKITNGTSSHVSVKPTENIDPIVENNPDTIVELSKDEIEANEILKAMEGMNFSWEFTQITNINNGQDPLETTSKRDLLSSAAFSPISNKDNKSKLQHTTGINGTGIPVLCSTPIKKPSQADWSNIDNSFNDSFYSRVEASMILQESIVSKTTAKISANSGLFSQIRFSKAKLFSLKEFLKNSSTTPETYFEDGSQPVNFQTCIDMKFHCTSSVISLEIGDSGTVVPDGDGFIGWQQFVESFMALPNVDPKLISDEWIKNHYQMIIWKLITTQNRCHEFIPNDWLSPHHVMLQLKYRYDKEIDNAKRPILRRVCEQDDNANRLLILLVISIEKHSEDSFQVLISDGWYYVPAIFDKFLKNQIINNKIKIGTKLITCNAVWTGSNEPIVLPCSSFPPNCGLKLHGNSTRRARAYAKLGCQFYTNEFSITLGSLSPIGGLASLVNVIVNRVYPLQFMETIIHPNQETPQRIFRNERAEEITRKAFDQSKENIINSTVEKMFSSSSTNYKKKKMENPANLNSGEDILQWLNDSRDQELAQSELSKNQHDILRLYKENFVLNAIESHCPTRNVVPLLRVLVVGSHMTDVDSKKTAILTIWKPNDDLMSLIVEGTAIKIFSASVSHAKVDVQFSINPSSIALNNISSTRFERNLDIHENLVSKIFQARQILSIPDSCTFLSTSLSSCEIDCIGIVIALSQLTSSKNNSSWQHIVLANLESIDDGILLIKIWGGLQENYLTKIVEVGNSVRFLNLQFRKSCYSRPNSDCKIPVLECHYGVHSNAFYVSRKWNFHTVKDDVRAKLENCLVGFKYLEKEQHKSFSLMNPNTTMNSPLTRKDLVTKFSSLNQSVPKANVSNLYNSPKITTSTPKRLGVRGKRVLQKSYIDEADKTNEDLLNISRIETNEEVTSTGDVTLDNSFQIFEFDNLENVDPNSSIADLVKCRRRTTTENVQYAPSRKKKK